MPKQSKKKIVTQTNVNENRNEEIKCSRKRKISDSHVPVNMFYSQKPVNKKKNDESITVNTGAVSAAPFVSANASSRHSEMIVSRPAIDFESTDLSNNDWKLLPQNNAKDQTHRDYYDKLLSGFKCFSKLKQSFRCEYEVVSMLKPSPAMNKTLTMEGLIDCRFSFTAEIVCKSCNDYKPGWGLNEELPFLLEKCFCGQMAHLSMTFTNLGIINIVKINVSIEGPNCQWKIVNTTKDFQKDQKYQGDWKFQPSTGCIHTIYSRQAKFFKYCVGGGGYFSKYGNLMLICDIEILQVTDLVDWPVIKENPEFPGVFARLAEQFSDSNINPKKLTIISELQLSDVILCVGENKIHCHKLILSMSSRFFERMFASGMKESTSKEIVLKEITLEALKSILTFMYKDKVAIEDINVKLLEAADMYEIMRLRSICIKHLLKSINLNNVAEIWLSAYLHNIEDLAHNATIFMALNWKDLSKKEDIRGLCQRHTQLLFTISTLVVDYK